MVRDIARMDDEYSEPNGGCTAALAIGGLVCFGMFGLWFSPGWANGWPGGLHRNLVWPAGLAFATFSLVLVACAGIGSTTGAAFQGPFAFWPPARRSLLWLLACTPLA